MAPLATGLRNQRPWGTSVLSCIMQSDANKTELDEYEGKQTDGHTDTLKVSETLGLY